MTSPLAFHCGLVMDGLIQRFPTPHNCFNLERSVGNEIDLRCRCIFLQVCRRPPNSAARGKLNLFTPAGMGSALARIVQTGLP
jgi:hypothetical protein